VFSLNDVEDKACLLQYCTCPRLHQLIVSYKFWNLPSQINDYVYLYFLYKSYAYLSFKFHTYLCALCASLLASILGLKNVSPTCTTLRILTTYIGSSSASCLFGLCRFTWANFSAMCNMAMGLSRHMQT
jgi:hypothetical protein